MTSDNDQFDRSQFPADVGQIPEKPAHRRRRRNQKFVMVPNLWAEQLAGMRAHGSTYRVAFHLLERSWRSGIRTVRLSNSSLAKLGVGREGKANALRELRKAGLIAVEQHPRKAPVITVRFND